MEQQEKQEKTIRKLKKQLQLYVSKVEEFEGKNLASSVCVLYDISTAVILYLCCLASAQRKDSVSVTNPPVRPVNITRKEKEYRGMLEYRAGDESRLLKNVVTGMFSLLCSSKLIFWAVSRIACTNLPFDVLSDLKPRGVAVSFIPGLPAYIIFMCLRYADCVNDDQRVSTLLNSTISSIKGVIKVEYVTDLCNPSD